MARLMDKTFVTSDEQYNPAGDLVDRVRKHLNNVKMDTYNKRYVLRVTLEEVTEASDDPPDADDEE